MTNTKGTDHVDTITQIYIHDKAPQYIYGANVGLNLFMQNAEVIFHGGSDSWYPYIAGKINANYYTKMYNGAIPSVVTPVSTDLFDAAEQEGWGYFYEYESISHEELVKNGGDWAKGETVIPLLKAKADAFMDSVGWMYDQNIANGNASNNTIIGLVKVFDITNTNYLGWNFTSETDFRPKNVTIATSYTSLTTADLFEAYGDIKDNGRHADIILGHPDIEKKISTLTEGTIWREQGKPSTFGTPSWDVLGAKFVPWRAMPTTTSTKIYFLNFGNAAGRGVTGKDTPKVGEGKFWTLEFGGPKPHGMAMTGWVDLTDIGYPGVRRMGGYGALKMACTAPWNQAYISIA